MNTGVLTTAMDTRTRLSTLWLFATLNYLYCDVVTLMDPDKLRQFTAGAVGGMEITQGFLLGAGILVEIPIAMVLLSRILQHRLNRWANIIGPHHDRGSGHDAPAIPANTLLHLLQHCGDRDDSVDPLVCMDLGWF